MSASGLQKNHSTLVGRRRLLPFFVVLLLFLQLQNMADFSVYYQNTNTDHHKRVSFVSFPYKPLGSGDDVQCIWSTKSTFGNDSSYDPIQLAAFAEGMCTPTDPKLASSLHIFSQSEAIECLSPTIQQRNISLFLSGDSYTRQMFIGLADVLLGRPSNEELNGRTRIPTLQASNKELAYRHGNESSHPNVQFQCFSECYGNYNDNVAPFSVRCSNCMNSFTADEDDAVSVVGAGVHVLVYFDNRVNERLPQNEREKSSANDVTQGNTIAAVNETIKDLTNFFDLANQLIYVSMPSYQIEKVPLPYKNASHNTNAGRIHKGLLSSLAPQNMQHPFIDVFQLTRACHMENCSYDGGHRSRYVNRWKAQLLLNTLCEVHYG